MSRDNKKEISYYSYGIVRDPCANTQSHSSCVSSVFPQIQGEYFFPGEVRGFFFPAADSGIDRQTYSTIVLVGILLALLDKELIEQFNRKV